jgi:hypothetical protein
MKKSTATRAFAGAVLTMTLISSTVAFALASSPTSPEDQTTRLEAGLTQKAIPSTMTPSLKTARQQTASFAALNRYLGKLTQCDPARKSKYATAPIPCFFGATNSAKTAVLFGDSSTYAWSVALSEPLKQAGIRLALFEFSGCPSPDIVSTNISFARYWKKCNAWHKALPAAVAKLHPFAVLSSSASYDSPTTDAAWVQGYAKAFAALAPEPSIKRIVIGSSPWFSRDPLACIAVHQTAVDGCTLHYASDSKYGSALTRDGAVASAAGATLVPTVGWFCYQSACPVLIDNYIVYRDADHIFESYATHIGGLVGSQLAAAGLR